MKLNKTARILLAAATLWPFVYAFLFTLFVLSTMARMTTSPASAERAFRPFAVVATVHMFTIFWIFALIAFYIVHLFRTDHVPTDKKALWAVVLFLGHMLSMPVYWYLFIWREPQHDGPKTEEAQDG